MYVHIILLRFHSQAKQNFGQVQILGSRCCNEERALRHFTCYTSLKKFTILYWNTMNYFTNQSDLTVTNKCNSWISVKNKKKWCIVDSLVLTGFTYTWICIICFRRMLIIHCSYRATELSCKPYGCHNTWHMWQQSVIPPCNLYNSLSTPKKKRKKKNNKENKQNLLLQENWHITSVLYITGCNNIIWYHKWVMVINDRIWYHIRH